MEQIGRVRWTRALIWISILFLVTAPLFAETQSTRRTLRATLVGNPPVIDGELTDPGWQHADIATNFFRAKEGETYPAELDTEVRVLYDENMLYIGVRCEEPDMKSLRETMTRRDSFVWQNDCIEVMLDIYHDQRNCYIFAINTLGTQADERVGNERIQDEITYNFNSIFDYEFTPESHFFFVVVDSLPGDRAVFAKLAYLFEPSLPDFAHFN